MRWNRDRESDNLAVLLVWGQTVAVPRYNGTMTEKQAEAIRLYKELGTQRAVAERLGVGLSTVRNRLDMERRNREQRLRYHNDDEYRRKKLERSKGRKKSWESTRKSTLSKYRITLTEYNELYAKQEGRCRLCGEERPDHGSGGLLVDHDHETGRVRGLLCVRCNTRMAGVDDPEWLEEAIKYRDGV